MWRIGFAHNVWARPVVTRSVDHVGSVVKINQSAGKSETSSRELTSVSKDVLTLVETLGIGWVADSFGNNNTDNHKLEIAIFREERASGRARNNNKNELFSS